MAAENMETTSINVQFPFAANQQWLKSFPHASPIAFYADAWKAAFGFTARHLQDQAEYAKTLAECATPIEVLKCHGDFAQKCWARSFGEGSKILDTLRTNVSSPVQGK